MIARLSPLGRFILAGIDWILDNDWRIAGRMVAALLMADVLARVLP